MAETTSHPESRDFFASVEENELHSVEKTSVRPLGSACCTVPSTKKLFLKVGPASVSELFN